MMNKELVMEKTRTYRRLPVLALLMLCLLLSACGKTGGAERAQAEANPAAAAASNLHIRRRANL